MSIGSSGRIVIEVEPEVKRHLYSVLARDGMTLKDWFLREAQAYLASANQLQLELSRGDEQGGNHGIKSRPTS
jgi:hypothetical protein